MELLTIISILSHRNKSNLNGTYKSEGVKTYSGKYTEKNVVKSGDLLIAATDVTRNADIIGRAILVPDYYNEDLVFSMDIAKIISKNIPSSFLMMLFNSNHYHNYIKWYATGTLVLHLNLDGINRYNTELPPAELLKKFNEFYLPIAKRIYMTVKENQNLSQLRDWLLPMLMNGQVKVI
jgi:type I restriction enzyme, S subunit